MNILALVGLVTGFFSFALAGFVLLKSREKVHLIWALFLVSVSIWGWGILGFSVSENMTDAFFWWRIAEAGVILIPLLLTHFVLEYLSMTKLKRNFIYFIYFVTFAFLYVNLFTNYFFGPLRYVFGEFYYITHSALYSLFLIFFFGLFFYDMVLLSRAYKKRTGIAKLQVKYLLIALTTGFAGGATSYFPVYFIDVYPFWNITIFLSSLILTYAIIKHRLMDIKFVLRSSAVGFLSFSTVIIIAFEFKYLLDFFSKGSIGAWSDFFVLAVSVYIFPFIKKFYYVFANKYLFASLYDSKEVIEETTNHLKSILDINKIYRTVSDIIIKSFHSKSVGILSYSNSEAYLVSYVRGFKSKKENIFFIHEGFRRYILERGGVVVLSEMRKGEKHRYSNDLNIFKKYKIDVVSSLSMKGKNIGYIVLGPKESGDSYNDEDLRVLRIISSQMAVIMDSALMYEKVKNFNAKLKQEINKATKDLRKANIKLKKLDQAKSEFISIASHQLRTPLTVIKGYISMMLENNFGKLSKKMKDPMIKVYESNERLIKLVEGLLDVSRIESGRLQYDFKKEYLENIVVSVVDELGESASKKELSLLYDAPNKSLPEVKIDQEKMRQVILNLVDNAIKYTKEGVVKVTLDDLSTKVRFCVFDSGVGILEEDFGNLFKKFSRGQGISILNTEGTGLGLYVAKEIIKAHNGKIWAESWGEGQGSKFCFEIPVVRRKKAEK